MITEAFDNSAPLFTPEAFYGPSKDLADIVLPIFSKVIYEALRKVVPWEHIGRLHGGNGVNSTRSLCMFRQGGRRVAFYLSNIGSAVCATEAFECAHLTGAKTIILFGSAGSLDAEQTAGKYVVPTWAYRDEGFSYHYAPAADYIRIAGAETVEAVFRELKVPYVAGRVWTTDAFYRETANKANRLKSEGCLAVEMELAGMQALCDYEGLLLYDFLQTGDVLGDESYSVGDLKDVNHNLDNLALALQLAERVPLG